MCSAALRVLTVHSITPAVSDCVHLTLWLYSLLYKMGKILFPTTIRMYMAIEPTDLKKPTTMHAPKPQ